MTAQAGMLCECWWWYETAALCTAKALLLLLPGRVLDAAQKVDLLILCAAVAGKPYTLSPQVHSLHYSKCIR